MFRNIVKVTLTNSLFCIISINRGKLKETKAY